MRSRRGWVANDSLPLPGLGQRDAFGEDRHIASNRREEGGVHWLGLPRPFVLLSPHATRAATDATFPLSDNWGDKPILKSVKSWYWGHGSIGGNTLVWFTGLDVAGVPSVSAYLTPASSQSGALLYSTCDMTKFTVVHSKGGIFDISFFPDGAGKKAKAFHVHVKPSQLVGGAEGSGYARWSGKMTGGWAGEKNTTGVALYEEFGL